MVERKLPKLKTRVRFPSPAPIKKAASAVFFMGCGSRDENPAKRVRSQSVSDADAGGGPNEERTRCFTPSFPFTRSKKTTASAVFLWVVGRGMRTRQRGFLIKYILIYLFRQIKHNKMTFRCQSLYFHNTRFIPNGQSVTGFQIAFMRPYTA